MATPALSNSAGGAARSVTQLEADNSTVLVVAIFIGLHTGISLVPDGKLLAPFFMSFVAAIGVLWINLRQINYAAILHFLVFSTLIMALAVVTALQFGGMVDHLRSSALVIYSFIIGYGFYVGLTAMGPRRVERVFFWVTLVLTLGSALEILGPLKPISDAFREAVNTWRSSYDSTLRDMSNYGGLRPNFFASEPSVLGSSVAMSVALWIGALRSISKSKLTAAAVITMVAFLIIRSPNVLFGPVIVFMVAAFSRQSRKSLIQTLMAICAIVYLVFFALLPAVSFYVRMTFADVPAYMLTASYFARTTAPFLVAANVMTISPLFGVGCGNDVENTRLAFQVFALTGALSHQPQLFSLDLGRFIVNDFWQYWSQFGLAGGASILFVFRHFCRAIAVPVSGLLVFVVVSGSLWQGQGGINTPPTWSCVFLVAAVFALRQMASTLPDDDRVHFGAAAMRTH